MMFGRRKNRGATLVAANAVVRGDVTFSDELIINGRLEGNVLAEEGSNATVTISARGSVRGEIRVPNVVVNGTVEGDVYAGKHLELAARARVSGNVHYALIEMVMGATVDGQLLHSEGAGADPATAAAGATEPVPASPATAAPSPGADRSASVAPLVDPESPAPEALGAVQDTPGQAPPEDPVVHPREPLAVRLEGKV